jgi:hypothetical protein
MKLCSIKHVNHEEAVSHLIEYIIISGILILLIIITLPVVSNTLIEKPADQLTYYAFTDIANGVSTRIVDVYAIPYDYSYSNLNSKFDIPDDVAGRGYYVEISGDGKSQNITISRGGLQSTVSLAGIGATRRAGGNTTGQGINQISYHYP